MPSRRGSTMRSPISSQPTNVMSPPKICLRDVVKNTGPEDQFREGYRSLLFSQFRSLPKASGSPEIRQEAEEIVAKDSKATWEDLYRLEVAILALEDDTSIL